jgi:hypothetical protein
MSNKRKATGPSGVQQQAPERTRRDPEQLPPGVTPQDDEKRLLSRITLRKLVTQTLKVDLVRPSVYLQGSQPAVQQSCTKPRHLRAR